MTQPSLVSKITTVGLCVSPFPDTGYSVSVCHRLGRDLEFRRLEYPVTRRVDQSHSVYFNKWTSLHPSQNRDLFHIVQSFVLYSSYTITDCYCLGLSRSDFLGFNFTKTNEFCEPFDSPSFYKTNKNPWILGCFLFVPSVYLFRSLRFLLEFHTMKETGSGL